MNFFAATCAILFELGFTSSITNSNQGLALNQELDGTMQMAQTWTAIDTMDDKADKEKAEKDKKKAEGEKKKAE